MIGMNVYCIVYHLKRAQEFTISIKDIQYEAEKEGKAKTNPKSIISQEYHDFHDLFSKKDSNTLLSHHKYDWKIQLEEEQKPSFAKLYKMSLKELDVVKQYLDSYLAK